MAVGDDLQPNSKWRTYRESFTMSSVTGTPHFGFNPKQSGCYLIHAEIGGRPHCAAVHVDLETKGCKVWQYGFYKEMKVMSLRRLVSEAVDRKTVVTFHMTELHAPNR